MKSLWPEFLPWLSHKHKNSLLWKNSHFWLIQTYLPEIHYNCVHKGNQTIYSRNINYFVGGRNAKMNQTQFSSSRMLWSGRGERYENKIFKIQQAGCILRYHGDINKNPGGLRMEWVFQQKIWPSLWIQTMQVCGWIYPLRGPDS